MNRTLHAAIVAALLTLGQGVAMPEAQAQAPATQAYEIPAGDLDSVLRRFAAQHKLQLVYSADLVRGKRSSGLSGIYSQDAALRQLLSGSGLQAQSLNAKTIVLKPSSDAIARPARDSTSATDEQARLLPAVQVTAEAAPGFAGGQVASSGRVGMLGERDIMDTPFSQIVFTSEMIQNQQAKTLADVLVNDPSIQVNSPRGSGWEGFNMRGFQLSDGNSSFSVNGLYEILPHSTVDAGMMERVEVLKGPSALLNGMPTASTIGGTANLVTKRAKDTPTAQFGITYGSRSQLGGQVDLGRRFGPGNAFGARVNASYRNGSMPIKPNEEEISSAVLGLDYRGARVRISGDIGYQNRKSGSANRPLFMGAGGTIPLPSLPRNDVSFLPDWLFWDQESVWGMVQGDVDVSDNINAYASIGTRETKSNVLFANPEVTNGAGDWTASPSLMAQRFKAIAGIAGLNARFHTGGVQHLLALNVTRVVVDNDHAQSVGGPLVSNIFAPAQIARPLMTLDPLAKLSEQERSGVGIADTLSILDERVQFTLGVRNQKVESRSYDLLSGALTGSYSSDAWTPAYALLVKARDNVSLYANYIQGLQPGTVVGSTYANAGEVFPPYKSVQHEAGVKIEWSHKLMATVAVFQIAQPSTVILPTVPLQTLALDGEQRNRGVELNLFGEPIEGLRIISGLTLLDAELSKTNGGLNDGNQAAAVPDFQVSLGGEWDVRSLSGLTLTGRIRHSDEVYVEAANLRTLPSWTQVDVGVRYRFDSPWNGKPIALRLNLDNLLDKNYWIGRNNSILQSLPRTWSLSATFDF